MKLGEKTARRFADQALREIERRYALVLEGCKDGIWDWDLVTREIRYSARWKSALGYSDLEISSTVDEWFDRIHPDDRQRVQEDLKNHLEGGLPHFESEYRMLHRSGSYRWMLARGVCQKDAAGSPARIAGSQSDITSLRATDSLTGLADRVLFMDRLARAAERVKRSPGHLFAVLFIDLDRFKLINDRLGHAIGDQLLVEFARRIESELRATDGIARLKEKQSIARYGGDEFTVLLDDLHHASDALRVAHRLLELIEQPFHIGSHKIVVTASIGVSLSSTGYERPEDLLRDADNAMYRAKAGRRSRVELFDTRMRASAVARLQLESELGRAAANKEFTNCYQLIVNLNTSELSGLEALIRWQHPSRGTILPDEFIPIAEETGVIVPLGRQVLKQACEALKSWSTGTASRKNLMIAVNLSCRQLMTGDLTAEIRDQLASVGIEPSQLKLEITESTVMSNPEQAKSTLRDLKALGVSIGMDDFGTGYSSLSYLHSFPLDTLKIDRSFIGQIQMDADKLEIVSSIISLAHNLGLEITAEGIETPEQMFILRQLGCDSGQGFLFSHPVEASIARELIVTNPAWTIDALLSPERQTDILEKFHRLRRRSRRR